MREHNRERGYEGYAIKGRTRAQALMGALDVA